MSLFRGGLNNLKRKLQDFINDIDEYLSVGIGLLNLIRVLFDYDQNFGSLVFSILFVSWVVDNFR